MRTTTVSECLEVTAEEVGLTKLDLINAGHKTPVAMRARQIGIHIAKDLTGYTFGRIGKIFSRDRKSIQTAIERAEGILNSSAYARNLRRRIMERLRYNRPKQVYRVPIPDEEYIFHHDHMTRAELAVHFMCEAKRIWGKERTLVRKGLIQPRAEVVTIKTAAQVGRSYSRSFEYRGCEISVGSADERAAQEFAALFEMVLKGANAQAA